MFKKSSNSPQYNLFSSGSSMLSGKTLKIYEDELAWHHQFRTQVTMRINEGIFKALYSSDNGTPNASIRVLVGRMILKEGNGLSDAQIFESVRFNLLTRSALGLLNMDDQVPVESTYYLFRKKVKDYAATYGVNLFDEVFASITKAQCLEFNVSGKQVRLDSKLLGSNIAWLTRYELVHESLRLFYQGVKNGDELDTELAAQLDELLQVEGKKVVFVHSAEEVKSRLHSLGMLIYKVLPLFATSSTASYVTLKRVFEEQFKVDENQVVLPRESEEISAKSVQSPHDTDSHYRDKDGNKIKGYSLNITESCDDDQDLNLIGKADVRPASTSDIDFFQDNIEAVQQVFPDKVEDAHTDGAYHSQENQLFCATYLINWHLHAIQGKEGRYQLSWQDDGQLRVVDTKTDQIIEATKIIDRKNEEKWRIKTHSGYRYFNEEQINTSLLRQKIAATPLEVLQKRNNVEATIFQLGYHYPNDKSRYRGLIKHQMWANMRCLWVNFVRVLNFRENTIKNRFLSAKWISKLFFEKLFGAKRSTFKKKISKYFLQTPNIQLNYS